MSSAPPTPSTPTQRALAWLVHLYTALGLPLNLASLAALSARDGSLFFALNLTAVFVDATDGFMARGARVKERLPEFNGAKLDDLIDFLTFTVLPLWALPTIGLIPTSWTLALSAPLIASAYGFCQSRAKTDDAFVGFPSYWNIISLYFFVFEPSPEVILGVLGFLSVMVFVPIHYVYPTRTRMLFWPTMIGGGAYLLTLLAVALAPRAPWAEAAALGSLSYMLYYTVISLVHHRRVHAEVQR